MKPRQTLVVGSGAGGMTLALLLARAGRNVTLIEKQSTIGGYLRRFVRGGVRFDTGYHFSGGFDGVMRQMTKVLGIDDLVAAEPIGNRIVLRESAQDIRLPAGCGHREVEEIFASRFPGEARGIREFEKAIREIWRRTPMCDLTNLTPLALELSPYDLETARDFCDRFGLSSAAETAVGSFAMCHGSPVSETPMSFHGRIGFSIHDHLSRPVGGGDPMIAGFRREAEKLGITILTGTTLKRFADPDGNGECREAVLSDGTPVDVDEVFFATHPLTIRDVLPEKALTPSLRRRFDRMHESTGFFCAYYRVDDTVALRPGLISYFADNDLDSILRRGSSYSTGYLLGREPDRAGVPRNSIAAFRTMRELPAAFPHTHRERLRSADYREFKERIVAEIADDLVGLMPELKGRLIPAAAGTPLTCLDYDPPTGSAYGVCCVCGQSRIFGRLPVRNFYAAGQSALVPGVMGTMLTSFTVFRTALGEETYLRVLRESGLI